MTTSTKPKQLLLALFLAGMGIGAMAQMPVSSPMAAQHAASSPGEHRKMHVNPALRHDLMVQRHAKNLADLKGKLKLSAAQEGAWAGFTEAMKPPMQPMPRPGHEEWSKLSTPERIEQLQSLMAKHHEGMNKRAEATKTFYSQLSAEQKKVFDSETTRYFQKHAAGWDNKAHGMRGAMGAEQGKH